MFIKLAENEKALLTDIAMQRPLLMGPLVPPNRNRIGEGHVARLALKVPGPGVRVHMPTERILRGIAFCADMTRVSLTIVLLNLSISAAATHENARRCSVNLPLVPLTNITVGKPFAAIITWIRTLSVVTNAQMTVPQVRAVEFPGTFRALKVLDAAVTQHMHL